MALVSISKAAKLAGVSRQWLYDEYIDKGEISVDRSMPKRPKIDTSEIMRVFGGLQDDSSIDDNSLQEMTVEKPRVYNEELNETVKELFARINDLEKGEASASKEVELLREQIADLRADRDEWREQFKKQTLLLTAAQEQIQEKSRTSFWQRWFGNRKSA